MAGQSWKSKLTDATNPEPGRWIFGAKLKDVPTQHLNLLVDVQRDTCRNFTIYAHQMCSKNATLPHFNKTLVA